MRFLVQRRCVCSSKAGGECVPEVGTCSTSQADNSFAISTSHLCLWEKLIVDVQTKRSIPKGSNCWYAALGSCQMPHVILFMVLENLLDIMIVTTVSYFFPFQSLNVCLRPSSFRVCCFVILQQPGGQHHCTRLCSGSRVLYGNIILYANFSDYTL